jgi:putative ABC transport system ATP-binding protein
MEIFKEINATGVTVLIVTHEKDISEMTNKIIRLRDGLIESIEDRSLSVKQNSKVPEYV